MAIAALSVGSSAAATRARTLRVAVGFALGHALFLACGGALVVLAGWTIPAVLERFGELAGGWILIALGLGGLWIAATRRIYGHRHAHEHAHASAFAHPHSHWHLHVGSPDHHPQPQQHSHLPLLIGGVFAISALRALTMLSPVGSHLTLAALLGLIVVFAAGIVLSMSLFGIVLAGTLGAPRAALWAGHAASVITAVASVALGAYWVFWRV